MGDRSVHGDYADKGNNESARKGDLGSIPFRIQKTLRRLHPVNYRKPDGNETDGKTETEDKDHGKTFANLPDGNRGKQNGQSSGTGDNPAGYPQQNQPQRPQLLVAGREMMVMSVMLVV